MSVTLSLAEAERLVCRALTANRTSEENARATATALIGAEADGQSGHGLVRVPSYAEQARVGKVDGFAVPAVVEKGGALRVDARTGFAYPAIDMAIEKLTPLARAMGVAGAGIFSSHHCGQAGRHVERLAEVGLVAFLFSNTPSAMAFHGGVRPRSGTDPLAFAAPLPGRAPLVIDMALSVVARSRIVAAKNKGETIPSNWAIDSAGTPATDPAKALAGTLLPLGGAKGSALALMVEILCGALAGAHFAWEASSFMDAEGGPPRLGQFLIALDPAHFAGKDFLSRMGELVKAVEDDGARLPGDRRLSLRARAVAEGLTIADALHAQISALTKAQP
ncbi:MAG TPA: Ldh family oxidoreductase [Rhizomicrobium sp.]|nr:Ldh family oxidoreductase [Rhizomicrobium sp.]